MHGLKLSSFSRMYAKHSKPVSADVLALSRSERRNSETRFAAFNSADIKTLMELFDENASWYAPG
jgi:hypothetical protein